MKIDPKKILRKLKRKPQTYKGQCGRILIAGGSVGYTGAPVLATLGALRSGAGLVTVAVPKKAYIPVAKQIKEGMPVPVADSKQGAFSETSLKELSKLLIPASVLAIGPGLSQKPGVAKAVQKLLTKVRVPTVLDADGLNSFIGKTALLSKAKAPLVLTPHPGELARLRGCGVRAIESNRTQAAKAAAKAFKSVVVLKGHQTVVASEKELYLNRTGNPGMATGGMGDVLTGVIAALMGQGLKPFEAAVAGVYLHGAAGDLAARQIGPIGLRASDIADRMPRVFKKALSSGV